MSDTIRERLEHMIGVCDRARDADELLTEPCLWRYDVNGFYSTSCFNAWHFESGDVGDNRVKYCPFCGRIVYDVVDLLTDIGVEIDRLQGSLEASQREGARLERELAGAKERIREQNELLNNWPHDGCVILHRDQINAALGRLQKTEKWGEYEHGVFDALDDLGIGACPECGGTKRIKNQMAENGTFIIDAECWCPHNGWVMEER